MVYVKKARIFYKIFTSENKNSRRLKQTQQKDNVIIRKEMDQDAFFFDKNTAALIR